MTKLPLIINAFIYTKNEMNVNFLCIKRIPEDGGFWQTVTGTVHDDESFLGTITREIKEECGINAQEILKIDGPYLDLEWMKGDKLIREFVYAVEVKTNVEITLAPDEHDAYRWCNKKVLLETLEKENNVKAAHVIIERLQA